MTQPGGTAGRTQLLAEVALLLLTVATVLGYLRLFDDGSFLVPTLVAAAVAHALAAVLRRLGMGPALALTLGLLGLPLFVAWVRYSETLRHALPTGTTVDRVGYDLGAAWDLFMDHSAPVPATAGFIVLMMASAWLVGITSDALAFRLNATIEAVAPAAGMFLFASILSGPDNRVASTAAFLLAALGFILAARVARAGDSGRWLTTDAGRGARSLLGGGTILSVLAVLVGVVAGPALPGSDGDGLLDLNGSGGGGGRVTVSPLVDIRARLIEQRDVEVFRVEAAQPSYWRLTSLDDFDGRIWSSSGSYVEVDGGLPETPEPESSDTRLSQSFLIGALAQIWLPAAFDPISVHSPDAGVNWDSESSTLVIQDDRETSDGLRYDVVSLLPHLSPSDLATGTSGLDTEFVAHYTALPESVAPIAAAYADEAVGNQATPYGQALALQNWFRSGFRYDLDVPAGHGADALAAFLDPTTGRVGYCEQFAGSYAALARSLGLPARVAVGFTPGEEDPDEPGTYVVRGRHAHAWPELYFAGEGWVPFEPTPGRGNPGTEAYTGVLPQQDDPQNTVTTTTAVPTGGTGTVPQRPTRLEDFLPDQVPEADRGGGGPDALTIAGYLLVGLAGLWVVGVPLVGVLRRARRRRRAHGHPDLEVTSAWDDSLRALAVIQVVPHPAETPTEFAVRSSAEAGTDRAAHAELADLVTAAVFGGESDVATARRDATVVAERARHLAGPWRRLRALVSPRHQLR